MIYVEKYMLIGGKLNHNTCQRHIMDEHFNDVINDMKSSLDLVFPLVYLKDINSDTFIKMEFIDGQIISSYILDLFDFRKNFGG